MNRASVAAFGVIGALATAAPASGEPHLTPTADDFAVLWARMDAGDRGSYAGELFRFAPHAAITQNVYLGVEADAGRIASDPVARAVARTMTGGEVYDFSAQGRMVALKAVAGMYARAGAFMGAGELAAGVREVSVESNGIEVASVQDGAVVEGHGRLDMWLGSTVTLGAIAGVDLRSTRNLSAGIVLGLHFSH